MIFIITNILVFFIILINTSIINYAPYGIWTYLLATEFEYQGFLIHHEININILVVNNITGIVFPTIQIIFTFSLSTTSIPHHYIIPYCIIVLIMISSSLVSLNHHQHYHHYYHNLISSSSPSSSSSSSSSSSASPS